MATPNRPGTPDPDEELKRIMAERDAIFEREETKAVDAKQALAEQRRKLQTHPKPR